jgi:hypothetical protein
VEAETQAEPSAELARLMARRPPTSTPTRRPDITRRGTTDADIASSIRRGNWTAVRPGRYLPSNAHGAMDSGAKHRSLIAGMVPDLAPGTVVSHTSAAALLGIPMWGVRFNRLHVSRTADGGMRLSRWIHPHATRDPVPSVVIDGVLVTSPGRTVIDCARLLPFEQGVVIADGALHAGIVTMDGLREVLHGAAGLKGVGRARAVVEFADGRSESVGESRSRVMLAATRLPAMAPQHPIRDERGQFVARVDFAIPHLKVAGEFDGKVKYGRLLKAGESAGDAVFREKRREDAVRDLGWQLVRWTWDEIGSPRLVTDRWERAIRRAAHAARRA